MRAIRGARLFEARYITTEYVRQSTCGGQDSELTGQERDFEHTFHVLAEDQRIADAAFEVSCGHYRKDKRFRFTQHLHDITPWLNLYTTV